MNTVQPSLPTVWVVALAITSSNLLAQDDRIFSTKGGAAVRGKILERTKDKVIIEKNGSNQSFPVNEIARIIFDGEPQQLSKAKDSLSQGNLDQAQDDFNKIDSSSLKTDDVKSDYKFFQGYIAASNALRGKGDASAASALLLSWVQANANSHHFYAAAEKLGELAMAAGTPAQAAKYFNALVNSPFSDFKVRGGYLAGKAALAQKQTADAKAKLTAVVQSQVSDPASLKLKKLAGIALVICDATEGKVDQALEALEKMVDEGDSSDAEFFAELYNAIGNILFSAGKNEEAVLAFLKTDLLYASEIDAHAEALYWLSQLWPKIGDNQRATETKSRLAKLYPTSPWLKK
jgi:tetratricopeptide (TPR) repeat protein